MFSTKIEYSSYIYKSNIFLPLRPVNFDPISTENFYKGIFPCVSTNSELNYLYVLIFTSLPQPFF